MFPITENMLKKVSGVIAERTSSLETRIKEVESLALQPTITQQILVTRSLDKLDKLLGDMSQAIKEYSPGDINAYMVYQSQLQALQEALTDFSGKERNEELLAAVQQLNTALMKGQSNTVLRELAFWTILTNRHESSIQQFTHLHSTELAQVVFERINERAELIVVTQVSSFLQEIVEKGNDMSIEVEGWLALFIYEVVLREEPGPLLPALIKAFDSKYSGTYLLEDLDSSTDELEEDDSEEE